MEFNIGLINTLREAGIIKTDLPSEAMLKLIKVGYNVGRKDSANAQKNVLREIEEKLEEQDLQPFDKLAEFRALITFDIEECARVWG